MQVVEVLIADTVQELRSVGSFYEVKRCLERDLEIKLGVRSWEALFEKLNHLKMVACQWVGQDYYAHI